MPTLFVPTRIPKVCGLIIVLLACACSKNDPVPVDKSSAKSVLLFEFSSFTPAATATIVEEEKKITISLEAGVSVNNLVPTIQISEGATIVPASDEPQDFKKPVTYTVTAEDGTSQQYEVIVSVGKRSGKSITLFRFDGLKPALAATIDEAKKKITAHLPAQTNIKALVPTITVSDGASVVPASGSPQDFSKAVIYKVTAEDLSIQTYSVVVELDAPTTTFTLDPYTGVRVLRHGDMLMVMGNGFTKTGQPVSVLFKNLTNLRAFTADAIDLSDKLFHIIIPSTVDAGPYELRVKIGNEVKYMDGTFEIRYRLPELVNLQKQTFLPGEVFTLFGQYFLDRGNKLILSQGTTSFTLKTRRESSLFIEAEIPAVISPGTYSLSIDLKTEQVMLYDNSITILGAPTAPAITSINRAVFIRNEQIVISGLNLKASGGDTFIEFIPDNGGASFKRKAVANADGKTVTFQIDSAFPVGGYFIVVDVNGASTPRYNTAIQIGQ